MYSFLIKISLNIVTRIFAPTCLAVLTNLCIGFYTMLVGIMQAWKGIDMKWIFFKKARNRGMQIKECIHWCVKLRMNESLISWIKHVGNLHEAFTGHWQTTFSQRQTPTQSKVSAYKLTFSHYLNLLLRSNGNPKLTWPRHLTRKLKSDARSKFSMIKWNICLRMIFLKWQMTWWQMTWGPWSKGLTDQLAIPHHAGHVTKNVNYNFHVYQEN